MTPERLGVVWRFVVVAALAGGLATSPYVAPASQAAVITAGVVAAGLLGVFRPRGASAPAAGIWLGLLGLSAGTVGVGIGAARLAAIDAGALDLHLGERVRATGFVVATPRRLDGEVRIPVDTADGRLLAVASEPVDDLPVGRAVRFAGVVRDPEPWESDSLARVGIRDLVRADEIALLAEGRGGAVSLLDAARASAEDALGRGTDPQRAALLRGFVLGQDDRIDAATVEEFRRSGLAHLLAVSGQNVLLLALLAWPLLALLGVAFRARLLCVLLLIAVYVPIAGAGPSIQRAGAMGAAGVIATLVGRPRSRWYAVFLATAFTLALNPRATGDVGWQLSFAAVVAIMLWARPLSLALGGSGGRSGASLRRALADGAAVTVSATLATAPLIAVHFETLSLASIPANLLALPAVAPVMWLGMLAGLAGQLPGVPVEPLTAVAGALAGYVAQVADWLGSPGWAQAEIEPAGPLAVVLVYLAVALAVAAGLRWRLRRAGVGPRPGGRRLIPALLGVSVIVVGLVLAPSAEEPAARPPGLRVSVLDVGQGDAILLQPRAAAPVLVDAGPAEAEAVDALADRGVERLGALAITHPQADHAGGTADVLGGVEVDRLLYARGGPELRSLARAADADPVQVTTGDRLRSGSLELEVLWPPIESRQAPAGDDPNRLSLVLLARWRRFEILLCGDAEAEVAAVDPGPIDVLKVAHHGSADAGLAGLLGRTTPSSAVISVGARNPYGHPAQETLAALADQGVEVARTDTAGDVEIEVFRHGWIVE